MPSWSTRFLSPSGSSQRRLPPPSDGPLISPASFLEDSTSSLISPQLNLNRRSFSQRTSSSSARDPRTDNIPQRSLSSHQRPGDCTSAVDICPSSDVNGKAMSSARQKCKKRPDERSAEMATGPCICCASTVRWPENLSQFRCSVCRTVNTVNHPEQPATAQEGVAPLSTETVRGIIEKSKRDFLNGLMLNNIAEISLATGSVADGKCLISSDLSSSSSPLFSDLRTTEEKMGNAVPPLSRGRQPGSAYLNLAMEAFAPLEEYVQAAFSNWQCLNSSFVPATQAAPGSQTAKSKPRTVSSESTTRSNTAIGDTIPVTKTPGEKEVVMLKMGHVIRRERANPSNLSEKLKDRVSKNDSRTFWRVPPIDWKATREFYDQLLAVGTDIISDLKFCRQSSTMDHSVSLLDSDDLLDLEEVKLALHEMRSRVLIEMLQSMESLLKRPGRPINRPEDIRFLLILLANPLLSPGSAKLTTSRISGAAQEDRTSSASPGSKEGFLSQSKAREPRPKTGGPGHNSFVLKRLYGLLSNLTNDCHRYILSWTSIAPAHIFRELVEIGGTFTTYRIQQVTSKKSYRGKFPYSEDWQLKAVARVMALLEKANNDVLGKRSRALWPSRDVTDNGRIPRSVHLVPVNLLYNMRLDYLDIVADFEAWERKESKFCFCQYPFYLSMGAKASIIDHDSKRQMESRARSAFISNISTRTAFSAYMNLKIRRDCIVEDSLKGIGESVGTLEEHKKGLKVEFVGEDGIDAGGLRKEWFLLLAREIFDPRYGLFVCEEDSNYCYFNPHSLESSEEFFLVGVLLGLAIYNSTILDVPLPPYLFRKLVANPPYPDKSHDPAFHRRESPPLRRTLADLAVIRPTLARGLQQLLDYDGDVESTFCRNFVFEDDRYGEKILVDLKTDGKSRPVTNENRQEFVDRYIKHILDDAVSRQFDPFRRGFYIVCGGNALGLLGPEELELIIRGSAEPLDVHALKAVAIYEGFGPPSIAEQDTVVRWFWGFFEKATPEQQRMLLSFITGSDRIPATGATSLIIKIACIGQDCDRFPVARTCFNQICLYRYKKREKFETMLWRAVTESEGFGLK